MVDISVTDRSYTIVTKRTFWKGIETTRTGVSIGGHIVFTTTPHTSRTHRTASPSSLYSEPFMIHRPSYDPSRKGGRKVLTCTDRTKEKLQLIERTNQGWDSICSVDARQRGSHLKDSVPSVAVRQRNSLVEFVWLRSSPCWASGGTQSDPIGEFFTHLHLQKVLYWFYSVRYDVSHSEKDFDFCLTQQEEEVKG